MFKLYIIKLLVDVNFYLGRYIGYNNGLIGYGMVYKFVVWDRFLEM